MNSPMGKICIRNSPSISSFLDFMREKDPDWKFSRWIAKQIELEVESNSELYVHSIISELNKLPISSLVRIRYRDSMSSIEPIGSVEKRVSMSLPAHILDSMPIQDIKSLVVSSVSPSLLINRIENCSPIDKAQIYSFIEVKLKEDGM